MKTKYPEKSIFHRVVHSKLEIIVSPHALTQGTSTIIAPSKTHDISVRMGGDEKTKLGK